MVGRQLTIKLKLDSLADLTPSHDDQIIPILRRQKGFLAATILISTDRSEAIANSLWDTKGDADDYSRAAYSSVVTASSVVMAGTPTLVEFDHARSTFPRANKVGIS